MKSKSFFVRFLLLSAILPIFGAVVIETRAQQTIFNVPSTDTLGKGQAYIEYNLVFKPNNQPAQSRFTSIVPRFVFGVRNNVEVGVNFTGNIQPGRDATVISPVVKWKVYNNEKRGIAIVTGSHLFVPIRQRAYKVGTYNYAAASKTLGKARFTAGSFFAGKGVFAPKATRGGGQFGAEYVLNKKVTFAADWITGKHSSGYFSPGLFYRINKRASTFFGYSVGNQNARKGNHFAFASFGLNID